MLKWVVSREEIWPAARLEKSTAATGEFGAPVATTGSRSANHWRRPRLSNDPRAAGSFLLLLSLSLHQQMLRSLLLVALVWAAAAVAQNCSISDCGTCYNTTGCFWCPSLGKLQPVPPP